MIINKQGQAVSNTTPPIHVFATQAEYESWKAENNVTDEDEKAMLLIFKYSYSPGCYIEGNNLTELMALGDGCKVQGVLYGTRENNKLYRYEALTGQFVPYN